MDKNKSGNTKKIILVLVLLLVIGGIFGVVGILKKNSSLGVKIVKNDVSKITLEDYQNDALSLKKPAGWEVSAGGVGIYYAVRLYDPNDNNNQVFVMLKVQPLLKSEAGKKTWQDYANLSGNQAQYKVFTSAVVLSNPTTEGFYLKFNDVAKYLTSIEPTLANVKFPTFNDFKKIEEFDSNASMKSYALDSKVLRATFSNENNKSGEGLFMASIVNFGNSVIGMVDNSYYMVYDITAVTAAKDNFIDYKDILLEVTKSIEFNDEYVKKTINDSNAQTERSLELNAQIQKSFDSYMSAWENRQTTYDIMSQKQSDATLGYERVYDTETGDIYKAYNGFTDDYSGKRYQSITDDMYAQKTSGYIEK